MFLFHIAIELTLRYQQNTEGGKKKLHWQEIYYSGKRQREKNRKREGKKMSPLAVALSQYVATIAVWDERHRRERAPLCLKLICGCNPR